jgi:uncharacterized protein (DUF427 family)
MPTERHRNPESVWDYPRPPRLEPTDRRIRVIHAGVVIAETTRGFRVLETSHPPVYYIPQSDIRMDYLRPVPGKGSYCEFKGMASYWTLHLPSESTANASDSKSVESVAWSYETPTAGFHPITGHLAFYASRVTECWVDEERVQPQPGDFYGGWITSDVVGPFKGSPGTSGW